MIWRLGTRRRQFGRIAVLLMWLTFSLSAALAQQCDADAVATGFRPQRSALDATHGAVLQFLASNGARDDLYIDQTGSDGLDRQEARNLLERYIPTVAASGDVANSDEYAIRLFDLVRMLSLYGPDHGMPVEDLAEMARSLLTSGVTDPQAVELAVSISDRSEPGEILRLVALHQRTFGIQSRQWALYGPTGESALNMAGYAYGDGNAQAALDGLRRERLAFAERIGNPRMVIEARIDLLRTLGYWKPNDPQVLEGLRSLFDVIEARAIADLPNAIGAYERGMLPDCLTVSQSATGFLLDTVLAQGTSEEKRRVLKFAVLHSLDTNMFATNTSGAEINAARMMQLRLFEPELYRQAMNYVGDCWDSPGPAYPCNEAIMADVYDNLNRGTLALEFEQSAYDGFVRENADPDIIALERFQLGRLHWKFGSTSTALDLIEDTLRDGQYTFVIEDEEERTIFDEALLEIYRAQRNDAEFERKLIEVIERRTLALEASEGGGTFALDPTPFVLSVFRGEICGGCLSRIDDDIERWIEVEVEGHQPGGFLSGRLAPDSLVGPATRERLAEQFLRSIEFWIPRTFWTEFNARRTTPLNTVELATLAALATYHPISDGMPYDESIEEFGAFLLERDMVKKRSFYAHFTGADELMDDYVAGAADSIFRDLLTFSDILRGLGYGLASQVVDEALHAEFERRIGALDAEAARKLAIAEGAYTVVPVLARLAGRAVEGANYSVAMQHLDTLEYMARLNLDQTWEAGDLGALLRLRQLQPSLEVAAQLSLKIAVGHGGDRQRAFRAMQMAMLSETALTFRLAERKRVLSTQGAEAALESVLDARRRQGLFAYYRDAIGIRDAGWAEQQTGEIDQALAASRLKLESLVGVREDGLDLAPVELDAAAEALSAGEALLLLHPGADGVYAMLVEPGGNGQQWFSPIPHADLVTAVAYLRQSIERSDGITFPFAEAYGLFQTVFGPAADDLTRFSHIYVVADGALLALPLAVLPRTLPTSLPEQAEDFRTASIDWMGTSHALSYLPTVDAILTTSPDLSRAPQRSFAGIGDPHLAGGMGAAAGSRGIGLINPIVLSNLAPLPETRIELFAMAQQTSARVEDVLVGPDANETRFRQLEAGDFRILAFATHGLLAGELEGVPEPGLVLSPPATPSAADDGYLGLSEILGMRLRAELVILSACNTAGSDGTPQASGLSGLARGFLSTGARSVAVTHWSIPSMPTVDLNAEWFRVKSTQPQATWAEAMRSAMQAMVSEIGPASNSHPRNWGAFMIFGAEARSAPFQATQDPNSLGTPATVVSELPDQTQVVAKTFTGIGSRHYRPMSVDLATEQSLAAALADLGVGASTADLLTRHLINFVPVSAVPAGTRLRLLVGASDQVGALVVHRLSFFAEMDGQEVHLLTIALSDSGHYVIGLAPGGEPSDVLSASGTGKQSRSVAR